MTDKVKPRLNSDSQCWVHIRVTWEFLNPDAKATPRPLKSVCLGIFKSLVFLRLPQVIPFCSHV